MARLTKTEAARQLGVSRTTLYRLIEHGMLSPTPQGRIDETELVRVAPYVDAIKERIGTSSDNVQERHGTPRDSAPLPSQRSGDEHHVTRSDSVQERHETSVTARHWTEDTARYQTHLEDEVDSLRTQVDRLQAQVERLHDDLRDARLARDRAQEEASTERIRYIQILEEFSRRYDRLLDMPRQAAQDALGRTIAARREVQEGGRASTRPPGTPHADARGAMRRRIVALLADHPEGLTPAEMQERLGVARSLTDTVLGMLRYGLLRRMERGKYGV